LHHSRFHLSEQRFEQGISATQFKDRVGSQERGQGHHFGRAGFNGF
jgi:hypothetical protein